MLNSKTHETPPVTSPRASNTPDNVSIKPQRMGFEFGDHIPQYWVGQNYLVSHTWNALSVLFPQGEQFFVDSVRAFRGLLDDSKLKEEVRGFIGQEAMHSLEHIAMNQHVHDQGMPVEDMERDLKVLLDTARRLPKRHQLAVTCALEHVTALLADMLLERDELREDMDKSMRPLWVWHAIEETEHKAVAYDVFQQAGGTYAERTAYLVVSTAFLGLMTTWFAGRMMLNDRKNFSIRSSAKGLWRLWGPKGTFSSLIPAWLEYFKPGFHPWDKDNSELVARFKAEIQQYAAPAYRDGNRRTLQ
ncbi:metal-dependent hydrolase [Marinobacter sediminum]|uniref:metal-dependent hydrolase n=1 Tax=Marinobacter sediminum TaxID=256323 RepID=UPI001939E4E5|nr:metal-dependent hydrolase [Marinobacter sediminum]